MPMTHTLPLVLQHRCSMSDVFVPAHLVLHLVRWAQQKHSSLPSGGWAHFGTRCLSAQGNATVVGEAYGELLATQIQEVYAGVSLVSLAI